MTFHYSPLARVNPFSRFPLYPSTHYTSYTFQVSQQVALFFFFRGVSKAHTFYDLILSLKMYTESCEMSSCHFTVPFFSLQLFVWAFVSFSFFFYHKVLIEVKHAALQARPETKYNKSTKLFVGQKMGINCYFNEKSLPTSGSLIYVFSSLLFPLRILSFIGLALCLSIMLMTSVLFAAIAMGMAIVMYKYIEYCG